MSFLTELKRRKVFQVAAVYLVVAWLIVQVVDVISGPLLLPDLFARIVIVVLAIGFPIALVLSWAFDVTPEGVIRDGGGVGAAPRGRGLEYALIGLLVIAVGFLFFDNYAFDGADDSAADDDALPNSVAVLPFDNLSTDPDNAYFAAGMHDEILGQLSKIQALSVISRSSVLQYADAGNRPPIPVIATALNVEAVMEGTVRFDNGRVRIQAQLIDGRTDEHLWAEVFQRDLADVFAIQAEIAAQISLALAAELSPDERQRIERAPTVSPEAYEYYLRARAMNSNIGGFFGDYDAFHGYLDRAIELDPNYAEAMAFKAAEYAFAASRPDVAGYESLSIPYREALALGFAEKALSLDPDVGLAHMALGLVHRFNWRGTESVAEFERAYQLNPNNDDILDDYGRMLSYTEQHDEAISIARRTAELRQNYIGLPDYLWRAGQCQEAADLFRDIARTVESEWASMGLALCELLLGNEAAARAAVRRTDALSPGEGVFFANDVALRAYLHGRLGDRDAAMRDLEILETMARELPVRPDPVHRALVYLGLGDQERALELLVTAAENRGPESWSGTEIDLALNSYRDPTLEQPEFVEVRARLGYRNE